MIEKNELALLEEERKKVCKESNIFNAIGIICIAAGIGLFFVVPIVGILCFVIGGIIVAVSGNRTHQFRLKFKENVITKLIKEELGPEAHYDATGGISMNEINMLKFAKRPDRHHTEDYIRASYNGVPYEICDCSMEERIETRDAKGNRSVSYRTYFKGRVIKIDFKRDLNMDLKVVQGAPEGFSNEGMTKFETEVIDFNKKFKCYTKNQEDGFYILTPAMISKMMEFEKLYHGGLGFIFKNNIFYVLINNSGNSLEVNIRKPIDETQLAKLRSDLLLAPSIINEFNMDSSKFNEERSID